MLDEQTLSMLRIALTPGLGPIRAGRCVEKFGSPSNVLRATQGMFESVSGIGQATAARIVAGIRTSAELAERQIVLAGRIGATIIARGSPDYPPLLGELEDAPLVLFCRGRVRSDSLDRYPVGIVGSRACTLYGLEQSTRFGGALARSGLTVVSGGARGIDTASHRGALDAGGRTIVVMGCGLAHAYPPENAELFESIVAEDRGAIISELPIETPATAENFPGRNRIISGLSLGVLVIEAGVKSGALITARIAGEEQGREVMALPGRVDSQASRGTLELIRDGGAAPVIEPGDVIHTLENAARHHYAGTHEARFVEPVRASGLFGREEHAGSLTALSEVQSRIVSCLRDPRSADQLAIELGIDPSALRGELTLLELSRRVKRVGGMFQSCGNR